MDWRDRRDHALGLAAEYGRRCVDGILDPTTFPAKATEDMRDRMTRLRAKSAAHEALLAQAITDAWCAGFDCAKAAAQEAFAEADVMR